MMTENADIARAQFEMSAAYLTQLKRIADTLERFMPRIAEQNDTQDPMERAVLLLMSKPDASPAEFAEACGLTRQAVFPGPKKEAEQDRRVAAGNNPTPAQQLRDFYKRAFTHAPRGRRGFNDGGGNVDGVEY